jgi:hypothetical protein
MVFAETENAARKFVRTLRGRNLLALATASPSLLPE